MAPGNRNLLTGLLPPTTVTATVASCEHPHRAGDAVVKGTHPTSVYRVIGVWQQESGKGPWLATLDPTK